MLFYWIVLPLVAAAIGWFTNFLAVRMIFRPHRPVSILGLKLQGLLPKRKAEFARSIGRTVASHLVGPEDVHQALQHPAAREKLRGLLVEKVDEFFDKRLAEKVPMLGAFLKGSLAESIKSSLVDEMHSALDRNSATLVQVLEDHMELDQVVEKKILDLDLHQLEDLVLEIARKELRAIELLGAVLGFLVGLVQVALIALRGVSG